MQRVLAMNQVKSESDVSPEQWVKQYIIYIMIYNNIIVSSSGSELTEGTRFRLYRTLM